MMSALYCKSTFVHLSVRQRVCRLVTPQSNCKSFKCTCFSIVCFQREKHKLMRQNSPQNGNKCLNVCLIQALLTVFSCGDDWQHDSKDSNHCLSCFLSMFAISFPGMREILYFKSKLNPHQMWVCSPFCLLCFSLSKMECPDPGLKAGNPARISVLPCGQCFNLGFQILWWKYFLSSRTENVAGRRSSPTGSGHVWSSVKFVVL